ncbi:STAS domain-containing protein [Virgibacillus kekensis]|uniref:STAS domain-containing protein n=1 Tax=Virgibacillus kekensis TaxID=202261 RepID=A0ABV9DIF5_9BACI
MIQYTTKERGSDSLEVLLKGDLDIDGTEVIEEELMPLLLGLRSAKINFENVPFVDSSGMGLLMKLVNTLKEHDITVTVSEVREDVYEVFELLQIPEIIGKDVFV